MRDYFLHHLSEFAARRAIVLREEAQLFEILARDFKREAKRLDEAPKRSLVRVQPPAPQPESGRSQPPKLFVGIAEAARMMGISRSTLYNEIAASRIAVKKAGKRTLIATSAIAAWFEDLPQR